MTQDEINVLRDEILAYAQTLDERGIPRDVLGDEFILIGHSVVAKVHGAEKAAQRLEQLAKMLRETGGPQAITGDRLQ